MKTYVKDTGKKENIHPEYIASLIDELATDDAIFTVDTGHVMCLGLALH
jgi:pyruvate dehydrogenase (quinone)